MFDPSATHIVILLVVVLLLFGARRLPGAAKSLGESMHIFKRSVQGLGTEDTSTAATPQPTNEISQPAPPTGIAASPDPTKQQLADLQRQVADLQRQAASGDGSQLSETQTRQPF